MQYEEKIKILKVSNVSFLDYPDSGSWAVVVYIMGCNHNCPGCHNPQFQDISNINKDIKEVSLQSFNEYLAKLMKKHRTNKLVLSGGDPLAPYNVNFVREFLNSTKYDVCIYTGYTWDYIKTLNLSNFKFLKCGRYLSNVSQTSEKTDEYFQLASKNQKLYNSNFELLSKDGRYYF